MKDTKQNITQEFKILFTIPQLGWQVLDTAQGPIFEFADGSHDWPTPREQQLIEAFQTYVNNNEQNT